MGFTDGAETIVVEGSQIHHLFLDCSDLEERRNPTGFATMTKVHRVTFNSKTDKACIVCTIRDQEENKH